MPSASRAAVIQDQTDLGQDSERKSACRAVSVPVGRRESSGLECLRSRKSKLLVEDVEDRLPSSLPTVVARGRKRAPPSCIAPQSDGAASIQAAVAESTVDTNEQRPRKRRKRSLSTPPAPMSSQLVSQLQACRRSRSRPGSSATNADCAPPPRVSLRLSRRVQSLVDIRTSDIYTHLADPDSTRNLLNESSAGSVTPTTPNEVAGPVKKTKGRRRKTTDLANENTKKDLMAEWVQLRQSQGAFPLTGISGHISQTPLDLNREGAGSVSSMQLETIPRRNIPNANLVKTRTTSVPQPQETMHIIPIWHSSLTPIDPGNASPVGTGALGIMDHEDRVQPSDDGTEQLVGPGTPSASIVDSHLDENFPTLSVTGLLATVSRPDLLQCSGSSPPLPSASTSGEDPNLVGHTELTDRAEAANFHSGPKNGHLYSSDDDNIHLNRDEEFHMLDIPEIFTLPWVPLSSHLYVPPSLGKLVSAMREQLMMVARAHRRAEELYHAELSKRTSAEKIIEELRTELQGRRGDLPGERTC